MPPPGGGFGAPPPPGRFGSAPGGYGQFGMGPPGSLAGGAKRISDEYLLRDAAQQMASDSDGSAAFLARCARPYPPARPPARPRTAREDPNLDAREPPPGRWAALTLET